VGETAESAPRSGDPPLRIEAPQVTLPKGGGAIRAIAEKYGLNPVTGTGSLTVPVFTSPGRSGFGPQIALSYDSGTGNGPFGIGWSAGISAIVRETDKGLPRYSDAEGSDTFTLAGSEDLVPLLVHAAGDWVRHAATRSVYGQTYTVQRYRSRLDNNATRIERWSNTADAGDCFWRTIGGGNVTTWYGRTAESRLADPADPTRIFAWYVCESHDSYGNVIAYRYKPEDSRNVDTTTPEERNRTDQSRSARCYLKHVLYGNKTPYFADLTRETPAPMPTDWSFEVVFDYGEHDAANPLPTESAPWPCRPDPFSTYRPAFEVRTYRLCRRVLMFHHFEREAGVGLNCLVRSTDLTYAPPPSDPAAPPYSYLAAAGQTGYRRDDAGGLIARTLPPLECEYSAAEIDETVREVDPDSLANLPSGVDGLRYRWVDLDGEGLQGILSEQGGTWFYKSNISPVNQQVVDGVTLTLPRFSPAGTVLQRPATASLTGRGAQRLIDLSGDGQLDLVDFAPGLPGFFERNDAEGWHDFRAFAELPRIDWDDPQLAFIDLTGDGLSDVLVTEDRVLHWHPSLGAGGFAAERRIEQAYDEEQGPKLIFDDGTKTIFIGDMSGDGLPDLVRVRNGDVCYWPNLGYGRFGAKITMDGSPRFDRPELYDARRVRLADLDGSGTADIVYFGSDGVDLYFNRAGNGFGPLRRLAHFPRVESHSTAAVVDLLGNGTACLVWSSPLAGNASRPMRYIDLMGGRKPHLMVRSRNNMGAETVLTYAPSTKFYVADKLAGTPWVTRLPFPVHVVEQVETYDYLNRNLFVSRYSYHHGYFDGVEREFRGFGRVEQWDTAQFGTLSGTANFPAAANVDAASNVPPIWTRTWYHTGAFFGAGRISKHLQHEYYVEGDASDDVTTLSAAQREAMLLDDTILPTTVRLPDSTRIPFDLDPEEMREAARALRGAMLRQEVYGFDGSDAQDRPYTVTEQNFSIEMKQPRGDGDRYAVFMVQPRETISFQYDRKLYKVVGSTLADPSAPAPARSAADPRVTHAFTLETDVFGNVLRGASVSYGRRYQDPDLSAEDQATQAKLLAGCAISRITNSIDLDDAFRVPMPAEHTSYELLQVAPAQSLPDITNLFAFAELDALVQAAGDGAHDLPTEEVVPTGLAAGQPYRRLLTASRRYYRPDDLGSSAGDVRHLLALGQIESLALAGAAYALTTTDGLIAKLYRRGGTPLLPTPASVLTSVSADGGGYADLDGDGRYWAPSGRAFFMTTSPDPTAELAQARAGFFRTCRFEDIFGQASVVSRDAYNLYVTSTTDAKGNAVSALLDYRVLSPWRLTDANGNQSSVGFDALGMVVASAVMGKSGEGLGDQLAGFTADPAQADIDALYDAADPTSLAAPLLGQATTRVVYDANRFYRTRQAAPTDPAQWLPSFSALLVREVHVSDLTDGATSPIRLSFSYTDGFNREMQRKVAAEPGPVVSGGPSVAPRWIGSGWTVFNNKNLKVREYEPFFSQLPKGHQFEYAAATGVSPILCYDPGGRVVAKILPDHSYEKVIFDPWWQASWDNNDTVLQDDPALDPDVGDYFARLPAADYLPSWKKQRDGGALGPQEQAAAVKAAAHADTPSLSYLDSMGRSFLAIADNGAAGKYPCHAVLDVQGQQRAVIDSLGRTVMTSAYDASGQRVTQSGMDGATRWLLKDALGNTIRAWDSRGHDLRSEFDELRRPSASYVLGTDGANSDPRTLAGEVRFEQTEYGEGQANDQKLNIRTRIHRRFDTAGVVCNAVADPLTGLPAAFDFKGNSLGTSRQLLVDHKLLPDWSKPAPALGDTYVSTLRYDALDRLTLARSPDGSVAHPTYNAAGLLERLDVNLLGAAAATPFVGNIDYDVKGRRQSIAYGSGAAPTAVTGYDYDPLTFRLRSLTTTRPGFPAAAQTAQALAYSYDPGGRITHIADAAQQTVFFSNRMVEPSTDFTYDPLYRLIEAVGREQLGLTGGTAAPPAPSTYNDGPRIGLAHPGDGNAMGLYREQYAYDDAGNLLQVMHAGSNPANPGWTRSFSYAEASLLEPAKVNNRLSSSTVGSAVPLTEPYDYDAHGNTTRMPQLQAMQWDFRDQLVMSQRQAVNDNDADGKAHNAERTWYVYNATGQRVRKVTESAAGAKTKERIYLGALEIYREYSASGAVTLERQTLHVTDDQSVVALVETETGEPSAIRFQFGNQLGTATLELDDTGAVITYEEYYPFGSTSYQAGRSGAETSLKRYRYTGKERDEESGLYYYGARYYAAWLGRWMSADPIGLAGGTNFYAYCRGDPVSKRDPSGTQDENDTAIGITLSGQGIRIGSFNLFSPGPNVISFGRSNFGPSYMDTAELNTGLTAINIQDSVTIGHQMSLGRSLILPGMPFFPDSQDGGFWVLQFRNPAAGPTALHPMFSGVLTQEALEGNVATTLHFDMRGVNLTPPLAPGTQPGLSPGDFHASSEARQAVAHVASTDPGERKVDIVIQHEEGVTAIPRDSNTVQGAPLPARLADRMPNINNTPAPPPPTGNPGTGNTGGGTPTVSGGGSPGTGTRGGTSNTGTASADDESSGATTGGSSSGSRGGSGIQPAWAQFTQSFLGGLGRIIPGVSELELALFGGGMYAAGTSFGWLSGPLLSAAEAVPVAAGAGVVGAGAGALARAGLEELGVDKTTSNAVGFGVAVATGAYLGSFIPIPVVGTVGGAIIAGALYLFSFW
jgi:RHS repeat-associated protein